MISWSIGFMNNNRQESSRLEPVYMKKQTKNQSGECPTGVQQEALERYQTLSYTDKAIYRAIGKEYFRKKRSDLLTSDIVDTTQSNRLT